jgi:hypothetical protein
VVATDAPFHGPDGTHVNDHASTLAALDAQGIIVIGLKAPGAGGELDALAADTGGSVQDLSSNGENIAQAILDALAELTTDVWWTENCGPALSVTLTPDVHYDVPGDTTVNFLETIAVPPATPPGDYYCTVTFWANEYPDEGAVIGEQDIHIEVVPIPVPVDLKPGSCPNSFNVKKRGVLPVAVLGTEEFDVTTADPASLRLTREGYGGVAPLRWAYEDVGTPFEGDLCDCHDLNGDGYLDLTLKYDAQEVKTVLDLGNEMGNTVPLQVLGRLLDEAGGMWIGGWDCLRVLRTTKK